MILKEMTRETLEIWRVKRNLTWAEVSNLTQKTENTIRGYCKDNRFPFLFQMCIKGLEMLEIEQGEKFKGSLKK